MLRLTPPDISPEMNAAYWKPTSAKSMNEHIAMKPRNVPPDSGYAPALMMLAGVSPVVSTTLRRNVSWDRNGTATTIRTMISRARAPRTVSAR